MFHISMLKCKYVFCYIDMLKYKCYFMLFYKHILPKTKCVFFLVKSFGYHFHVVWLASFQLSHLDTMLIHYVCFISKLMFRVSYPNSPFILLPPYNLGYHVHIVHDLLQI